MTGTNMAYSLIKSILFSMDPERAHDLALRLSELAHKSHLSGFMFSDAELKTELFGLTFKNPVGLAAGLDKNGAYIDALAAMGFGFIEIGTVTPRPQPGNAKPRLFRLTEAQAIINRFGFNNVGVEAMIANIKRAKYSGILGVNIGKNAVTPVEKAAQDYLYCLERVYEHASYITVNISSPNTKNLRDLQEGDQLARLLDQLKNRQQNLASRHQHTVPLLLKVAPDLDETQIEHIAKAVLDNGIDGLIATNTTLDRDQVTGMAHCDEQGGLSGAPVRLKSDEVLKRFSEHLGGQVPLIGVGGITEGAHAAKKIQNGASLVQLYSGMIYEGADLIYDSVRAIDRLTR